MKMTLLKASPTGKAQIKADLEKGQTKAKTAKTPANKQKLAKRIMEAQKTKSKLATPGELARCRAIVDGDWRAAMLLYRIAYLWRTITPKLSRHGKEWLAMSRADWAMSAGLSDSELINYALPRLRTHSFGIVELRAMGRGKAKKLWVTFDPTGYLTATSAEGHELKVKAHEGVSAYTPTVLPFPPKT